MAGGVGSHPVDAQDVFAAQGAAAVAAELPVGVHVAFAAGQAGMHRRTAHQQVLHRIDENLGFLIRAHFFLIKNRFNGGLHNIVMYPVGGN